MTLHLSIEAIACLIPIAYFAWKFWPGREE